MVGSRHEEHDAGQGVVPDLARAVPPRWAGMPMMRHGEPWQHHVLQWWGTVKKSQPEEDRQRDSHLRRLRIAPPSYPLVLHRRPVGQRPSDRWGSLEDQPI